MSEQFAPWIYRPNEVDDWGVVKDARGHWVCQAKGPERDDDVLNEHRRTKTDPWAERAQLIAAAPELLAALKAMFGIDSQIDVAFAGNPIVIEDVKKQVFDAIAKAEKRP